MLTYQDLLEVGENENDRIAFIRTAINQHKSSTDYQIAEAANLYYKKQNPDIAKVTKTLFTVSGKEVPDIYSTNYKVGRAFFPFFIMQEVQYLLGNGVTWVKKDTPDKIGKKGVEFDTVLQKMARIALVEKSAYGFWNLDHVDMFAFTEFVPLYDENNGSLRSGIRFWQIDPTKPLRATLYEEDGYTDYMWNRRSDRTGTREEGRVFREKRSYIIKTRGADVDEEKIYNGENYPTLPIVPLWGNEMRQSEIVGLREQIFVYDAIKSGFCNNVEEASSIYWAISNAPGMDEIALSEFLARVRRTHTALTEDNGSTATPHQIDTPTASREALLNILDRDLFKDAMAFDPERVASGAVVTAQIKSAYNSLDMKVNGFEYCVREFIDGILTLAGVDDEPTFTRDKVINVSEEIQTVLQAATALDDEYVTKKVMTLLGDGDQAEDVIRRRIADEVTRERMIEPNEETEPEGGDVNAET